MPPATRNPSICFFENGPNAGVRDGFFGCVVGSDSIAVRDDSLEKKDCCGDRSICFVRWRKLSRRHLASCFENRRRLAVLTRFFEKKRTLSVPSTICFETRKVADLLLPLSLSFFVKSKTTKNERAVPSICFENELWPSTRRNFLFPSPICFETTKVEQQRSRLPSFFENQKKKRTTKNGREVPSICFEIDERPSRPSILPSSVTTKRVWAGTTQRRRRRCRPCCCCLCRAVSRFPPRAFRSSPAARRASAA